MIISNTSSITKNPVRRPILIMGTNSVTLLALLRSIKTKEIKSAIINVPIISLYRLNQDCPWIYRIASRLPFLLNDDSNTNVVKLIDNKRIFPNKAINPLRYPSKLFSIWESKSARNMVIGSIIS